MNPRKNLGSLRLVMKNTKFFLWAGVIAVLAISLLVMRAGIEKTLKQASLLKQEIIFVQQTLNAFADLKTQKQQAEPYRQKLAGLFPGREGLLRAVAFLEDRANVHHLEQFFTFGAEIQGTAEEPDYIAFNLSLTGGLLDLVDYLVEVESSPYLISFSGLEIVSKGKNVFQINTVGKIYIQSNATYTQ